MLTDTGDFLAVLLAAALAPILSALATRAWSALVVPVVVAELLLGVVIGPDVLGLASQTELLEFLGQLGLGLFASTQLPLVVAITTIGVEQGHMRASTAAALVGAAVLSVLVFQSLALARRQ